MRLSNPHLEAKRAGAKHFGARLGGGNISGGRPFESCPVALARQVLVGGESLAQRAKVIAIALHEP